MNKKLLKYLRCLNCNFSKLILQKNKIVCLHCGKIYQIKEGIPIFFKKFDKKKYKHWDKLYNKRECQNEIRWMENVFNDINVLQQYYAITYFFNKYNLKFNNSLEIGSGLGKYSLILKKLGFVNDVNLVDVSFPSLLITKEIFKHFNVDCNLILADAKNLPFKDKCFNLSFSGGLIEHFLGLRQEKIFGEHCRVSNNVIIQVPTSSFAYWLRRILLTIIKLGWPFGFERPLSNKKLRQLFLMNNYKTKNVYYHDFLTASLFIFSFKIKFLSKFVRKYFISKIFKSDLLMYGFI